MNSGSAAGGEFSLYAFHLLLGERVEPHNKDGEGSNCSRNPAHQDAQTEDGGLCLDRSGNSAVAESCEHPHHGRSSEGTSELLSHGCRGEDQTCGSCSVLKLGPVSHIGLHAPYKRRDYSGEHGDHKLEGEHRPVAACGCWKEEEQDAQTHKGCH